MELQLSFRGLQSTVGSPSTQQSSRDTEQGMLTVTDEARESLRTELQKAEPVQSKKNTAFNKIFD